MARPRSAALVFATLGACAAPTATSAPPHGAAVRGLVLSADGDPLAAARVRLSCTCLPRSLEATTGPDGAYVFQDLPAGTYAVQARHGDLRRTHDLDVPQGSKQRLDLQLWPPSPFRISGALRPRGQLAQ